MAGRPTSWVALAPSDTWVPHAVGESIMACGVRSPTGAMYCILPAEAFDAHHFNQHLGLDRHGNFRGWPVGRYSPGRETGDDE